MIRVKNLEYNYPKSDQKVLKGLHFDVRQGETSCFMGPQGSGKSTLLKILVGILKDNWGEVLILDKNIKYWGSELYNAIGVCFEFPNHYHNLSALENLQFFASLYSKETEDPLTLLAAVGLEGDAHTRVHYFSQGMKMRLNIARALIHKPHMLFLDEPTRGIDPSDLLLIRRLIATEKQKGTTVFITASDAPPWGSVCDTVAFLVDGELREFGSPEALRSKYGRKTVQVEYASKNGPRTEEFSFDAIKISEHFQSLLRDYPVERIQTIETSLEHMFEKATGRKL